MQQFPKYSSVAPAVEALPEELEWPYFCVPALRDIWYISYVAGFIAYIHTIKNFHPLDQRSGQWYRV